jgi:glycosyltransferase involved in cell wall biosynthesis
MNVGFFSSMNGGPWGGSEELWAAAARAGLTAGHGVRVSVLRWRPRAEAIDALARDGATVCERPRFRSKRMRRLAAAATLHDWRFAPTSLDVLCICQGGTYDFLAQHQPATVEQVTDGGRVPYVVVCQYNDERSIPSPALRERARAFFQRASKVVFVAEQNRRLASRQLACELPTAVVLNNPVNLSDAAVLAWPAPSPEGARLACVARFSVRHKGQDVLLEALAAPAWRDRAWRLRFYGGGPDEAYVRALVAYYGLQARIDFMGHVSDIRALWCDNELLVLPSYGEGTPLSLLEAMLCGRPAVVTDVGGSAEWVAEGETGFVAAAPTARSVGDALERAWSVRERWRAMGDAARLRVVGRYDPTPGRSLLAMLEQGARRPVPLAAPEHA